jgi:hypothetical protein
MSRSKPFQWITHHIDFVNCIVIAITVLLIQLPFGLQINGIYEEWVFFSVADRAPASILDILGPINRPFLPIPFILANVLTPSSFLGLNVLSFVIVIGIGISTYFFLRQLLPQQTVVPLVSALLFILYPADTASHSLRIISLHFAVLCFVLSNYLLLVFYDRPSKRIFLGMILVQLVGLLTYDGAILLTYFAPVFLIWKARKLTRKIVLMTLIWYIVPTISALLLLLTYFMPGSYTSFITKTGNGLGEPIPQLISSMAWAYSYNFWESWLLAVRQMSQSEWMLPTLGTMLWITPWIIINFLQESKRYDPTTGISKGQYRWLVLLGFIMVGLGYIMYYPTIYRDWTWRTFLYASLGAALSLSTGIYLLFGAANNRPVGKSCIMISLYVILIFLAVGTSFNTLFIEFERAKVNDYISASIVEQAPQLQQGTTIIVLGAPKLITDYTMGYGTNGLHLRLLFTYNNSSMQTIVCWTDADPKYPLCKFDRDYLIIRQPESSVETRYEYDSILVFDNKDCNMRLLNNLESYVKGASSYDPTRLIISRELPPRVHTIYSKWPIDESSVPSDFCVNK